MSYDYRSEMDVPAKWQCRRKELSPRQFLSSCEDELRERIEKLEKRQATDDATLLIVNRYWAQVDVALLSKTWP